MRESSKNQGHREKTPKDKDQSLESGQEGEGERGEIIESKEENSSISMSPKISMEIPIRRLEEIQTTSTFWRERLKIIGKRE